MSTTQKTDRERMLRVAHEWRLLMAQPDVTEAERRAFAAWYAADPRHRALYEHAQTFYHALKTLTAADLDDDLLRPTPLEYLIRLKARAGGFWRRQWPRLTALGALPALLVIAAVVLTRPDSGPALIAEQTARANYETARGQTRVVTLDDNTVLTLGAASRVETAYFGRGKEGDPGRRFGVFRSGERTGAAVSGRGRRP